MLRPEVLLCTKGDREGNRADWSRGVFRDDAVEWGLSRGEHAYVVEPHLLQCTRKNQVEPASAVDEYSSELGALDDWVEY